MNIIISGRFKNILAAFILCTLLLQAIPVSAADNPTCGTCAPGAICNPIKECDLAALVKDILTGVIKIGIPIIALAIIYCGFLFVSARGNSEKLKKAKDALLYTLIGAAVLLGSWAIAQLISDTVTAL